MPPYKNLAIIALAASSVSPALSAPTRGQEQPESRGEVEERMDMELLERLGLRAVPVLSSSNHATEALESRAIAELEGRGRALGIAGAGAVGLTLLGALGVLGTGLYYSAKNNRRDVSPAHRQMNSVLNALGERSDVPLEDPGTILRLLTRALNELD